MMTVCHYAKPFDYAQQIAQPSSVLVVCATHDDIAHVTAAIRAERQQAGDLGEGVRVDRYVSLHYTQAQKA
jgi:hypothetical protein